MIFIKDIDGDWIRTDMIERICLISHAASPFEKGGKDEYIVMASMKESDNLEPHYDLFWSDKESEAKGWMNELIKRINGGAR